MMTKQPHLFTLAATADDMPELRRTAVEFSPGDDSAMYAFGFRRQDVNLHALVGEVDKVLLVNWLPEHVARLRSLQRYAIRTASLTELYREAERLTDRLLDWGLDPEAAVGMLVNVVVRRSTVQKAAQPTSYPDPSPTELNRGEQAANA